MRAQVRAAFKNRVSMQICQGRIFDKRSRILMRQSSHARRTPALSGIFAGRVHGAGDGPWPSVLSFGTRPTVDGGEPRTLTNDQDSYGEPEFLPNGKGVLVEVTKGGDGKTYHHYYDPDKMDQP